jgi:CubicO group peptidase (beta-lactamase class C family)
MRLLLATIIGNSLLAATVAGQNTQLTDCSLLGPVYPLPASLATSPAIRNASSSFTKLLQQAIRTGTTNYGAVDSINTTVSIGVFSTQSTQLLAEYHHIGTDPSVNTHLTGGVLNGSTVYRTGSVAKLLTVYTFLIKLGNKHWNDPITNWLPELASMTTHNVVNQVKWTEVTLGALAWQMSGIPRDCVYLTRVSCHSLITADISRCISRPLRNAWYYHCRISPSYR